MQNDPRKRCTRCRKLIDGTEQGVWKNPYHMNCWIETQRERWKNATPEQRRRIECLMKPITTEE